MTPFWLRRLFFNLAGWLGLALLGLLAGDVFGLANDLGMNRLGSYGHRASPAPGAQRRGGERPSGRPNRSNATPPARARECTMTSRAGMAL